MAKIAGGRLVIHHQDRNLQNRLYPARLDHGHRSRGESSSRCVLCPVASDQRSSNFAISSDKVLLQADKKAATDAKVESGHFSEQQQDDFEIFLQNQGMGLPRVSRVVAKGYDVVKSSLKKVRFWGLREP